MPGAAQNSTDRVELARRVKNAQVMLKRATKTAKKQKEQEIVAQLRAQLAAADAEEDGSSADEVDALQSALADSDARLFEILKENARLRALLAEAPPAKKPRRDEFRLAVARLTDAEAAALKERFGEDALNAVGMDVRRILAATTSCALAEALLLEATVCSPAPVHAAPAPLAPPVRTLTPVYPAPAQTAPPALPQPLMDPDWEVMEPAAWPEAEDVTPGWLGVLRDAVWSLYDFRLQSAQLERDAILKDMCALAHARPPTHTVSLRGWLALARPCVNKLELLRNRHLSAAERALEATQMDSLPPRIARLRQALQTQKPPRAPVDGRVTKSAPAKKGPPCANFARGTCTFGRSCRFSHGASKKGSGRACMAEAHV